jgi:hypothetical protein
MEYKFHHLLRKWRRESGTRNRTTENLEAFDSLQINDLKALHDCTLRGGMWRMARHLQCPIIGWMQKFYEHPDAALTILLHQLGLYGEERNREPKFSAVAERSYMDPARFARLMLRASSEKDCEHISGLEVEGRHPRALMEFCALSLNQVIGLFAKATFGPNPLQVREEPVLPVTPSLFRPAILLRTVLTPLLGTAHLSTAAPR